MTVPPPHPFSPATSLAGPPAGGRAGLLRARAGASEAEATLRRSTALAWESPAADGFRDAAADLLAAVRADLALLDEATGAIRP